MSVETGNPGGLGLDFHQFQLLRIEVQRELEGVQIVEWIGAEFDFEFLATLQNLVLNPEYQSRKIGSAEIGRVGPGVDDVAQFDTFKILAAHTAGYPGEVDLFGEAPGYIGIGEHIISGYETPGSGDQVQGCRITQKRLLQQGGIKG